MDNVKERYEVLANWQFNDRETYLIWVTGWKIYYKELSDHIRETRAQIKESQRQLIFGPPLWKLIGQLYRAKHYATAALLLRKNCKKEAAYQVMIVMTHEESNDDSMRDAQISVSDARRAAEMAKRLHHAAESGKLSHVGVVGSTTLV